MRAPRDTSQVCSLMVARTNRGYLSGPMVFSFSTARQAFARVTWIIVDQPRKNLEQLSGLILSDSLEQTPGGGTANTLHSVNISSYRYDNTRRCRSFTIVKLSVLIHDYLDCDSFAGTSAAPRMCMAIYRRNNELTLPWRKWGSLPPTLLFILIESVNSRLLLMRLTT
ncbi:hypothetical protein AB1N83_007197 [Pleurotus pulmonarius]